MKLDPPRVGSVIRYSYLWSREAATGKEEGRKDRPAVVLTLVVRVAKDQVDVVTLAVSHSVPAKPTDAVQIPEDTKRTLGLDDLPSFIVTTEANAFRWPGPDVRPIPNRSPATFVYGRLPEDLMRKVAAQFLANRARGAQIVRRTR